MVFVCVENCAQKIAFVVLCIAFLFALQALRWNDNLRNLSTRNECVLKCANGNNGKRCEKESICMMRAIHNQDISSIQRTYGNRSSWLVYSQCIEWKAFHISHIDNLNASIHWIDIWNEHFKHIFYIINVTVSCTEQISLNGISQRCKVLCALFELTEKHGL